VFDVGRWVRPGQVIEVGSRRLEVLHTPGHSPDSVSLWEPDRNRLYAADFIYRGALYAQTPGASLTQYLETCRQLIDMTPQSAEIVCAHGRPEMASMTCQSSGRDDLADLQEVLSALSPGIRIPAKRRSTSACFCSTRKKASNKQLHKEIFMC
jgi:hydroxyacylglutathione hydrolase